MLFLVVKAYQRATRAGGRGARRPPCPYCVTDIPTAASRCPSCMSQIEPQAA